ncbi:expressed unknown protein [Seminavis robusta]|uniref:Uncharacterized protein n=1 Tax=Seminavis robusta TaxID=568900 RepID=A0A9N8HQ07_9STRA|nr:expressed unknown protein [Seminavis robusta]|eukprot:Sro1145_g246260.1 n/a (580) ;mRNA; r:30943-32820
MSTAYHVRFDNEPRVIAVLPVEEAVGSDCDEEEEPHDPWEEDEAMDRNTEDPSFNDEQEELARDEQRKKKAAKPPPFQLLRWQEQNKKQVIRTELFEELRAYEAQRRTTFSAKLEATQLYFKSLMDLLQNSFDETAKVYRLALGTSIAQSQYARAITQRGVTQAPRDSSPSAALLHSWQEANTILAATLEESAVDIEDNVVSVLSSFQDALQDQKNQFENVGKPILAELEHMEAQVQKTWEAYWRTAAKSMDSGSAGAPVANNFEEPADSVQQADVQHIPIEDLWVVEMQYQMSVSLQRSTWEKRGPEIVRLAASSKEMEVTRRIKLNECMVQFLNCLQKLFKSIGEEADMKLPSGSAMMVNSLEAIHSDMEKRVKSHVEANLPDEFQLSLPDDSAAGFGLDCEGLVITARVMEWKNSYTPMSAADRWRIALAVITVDQYLHIFDLSPFTMATEVDFGDPKIYPGCDPRVAMEHLFPFFSKEAVEKKQGNGGHQGQGGKVTIRDKMVPERTLRLSKNCTFQQLNGECCELTQKTVNKSRFLGKRQKPLYKAQLRILSVDPGVAAEKDAFFALLKQATRS